MPIRGDDGRYLSDFCRYERQTFFRQSQNINLNLERIVRAELGNDSAREDFEILEALEDTSNRTRISVSDDSKSE